MTIQKHKTKALKTIALSFLLAILTTANPPETWAAPSSTKEKTIVMIDPGHGGEDFGATNRGIIEKNITLAVALELKTLLSHDDNFTPLLTRDYDTYVALGARKDKADAAKADVFVSIHANSSTEAKARGTEIYFENQVATDEESQLLANKENSANSGKPEMPSDSSSADLSNILTDLAHNQHMVLSQQLAQLLLYSFQNGLKIKTRAIRQAPFRVLSVTMPATLIELGFISNSTEGPWLAKTSTQKEMAHSIYLGLKRFKEKLDKVHHSTVK